MTNAVEPTTVGLSESCHKILRRLKADGYFPEMQDAYRFAIALAARSVDDVSKVPEVRSAGTIFNIGTLDPDRSVRAFIESVLGVEEGRIYKTAEKLAEAGIAVLGERLESGTLNLTELVETLRLSRQAS